MVKHLRRGLILLGGSFILVLAGCSANGGSADNPGTQTSGPVSIATDHTTYTPAQGIQVTVKNGLSEDIYALDTRASCSILGLEQQVNGAWQASNASRCPLGRIARQVRIGKGQSYTATIQPGGPGVRNAAFPNGTYRLVLVYSTGVVSPGSSSHATTIYSATLTVAGQAPSGTSTQPAEIPSAGTPVSLPESTPKPGP
jgi:hypothetical protein